MATSSSKDLTCLQDFLNLASNRPKLRDVPKLSSDLLTRVRNSRRYSIDNNDLLEFLGDRCVNLMAAVLVERVRVDKVHHTAVRRVICNNDTFGRVSFYLRFHEHAALDEQDLHAFDDWNPQSNVPPPKALADLFEAYCGAVYLQHGWKKLERWLDVLFRPIIQVATGDFWYNELPRNMRFRASTSYKIEESRFQSKLLDFLEFKRDMIVKRGQPIKGALPSDTQIMIVDESLKELHHDDAEISVQLLNFWICKIIIRIWPEYHRATAKATHLATTITELIAGDKTMASIARIMTMDSFVAKPDDKDTCKSTLQAAKEPSPAVLASVLRAAIGMVYHIDPDLATANGEKLLEPLVIRAHDILIQDSSYKPVLRRSATKAEGKASMPRPSDPVHDPISALVDGLKSITIAEHRNEHRKPTTDARQSSGRINSDAVSDLVGQLQSVRLEDKATASPVTPERLKLDDLFDLSSSDDSRSEEKACRESSLRSSRRYAASSPKTSPSPTLFQSTSSNDSPSKPRSSGKWKPIAKGRGEMTAEAKQADDAPKKSPPEPKYDLHKSGDTDSDGRGLSTTASTLRISPDRSDGRPDSGYASSTSPPGSRSSESSSPTKAGRDSSKGSPSPSLFLPRQVSRKSQQAPKAKEPLRGPLSQDTQKGDGDGKKAEEDVCRIDSTSV